MKKTIILFLCHIVCVCVASHNYPEWLSRLDCETMQYYARVIEKTKHIHPSNQGIMLIEGNFVKTEHVIRAIHEYNSFQQNCYIKEKTKQKTIKNRKGLQ